MRENILPALTIRQLRFSWQRPAAWSGDLVAMGCRLRGSLGLALKSGCCFFDAKKTPCDGCLKRPYCHYGQAFEAPKAVQISGVGRMASLPHAWSLTVDQVGLHCEAHLNLAGMTLAHESSWRAAIEALPLEVVWQESIWINLPFSYTWQGVTPVRLRLKGKSPRTKAEVSQAIVTSIVSKSRMLALLHGQAAPEAFLAEPYCLALQWHEASRYAFREGEKQSLSGWLAHIRWPETVPEAWLPWLQLSQVLGVGRQTSFGLGRFVPSTDDVTGENHGSEPFKRQ